MINQNCNASLIAFVRFCNKTFNRIHLIPVETEVIQEYADSKGVKN